jgi:uncharacterized protein YdhG (YjbR/CyaY superfamily)
MNRIDESKAIDDYIAACDPAAQTVLTEIRRAARAAVPGATETISYKMPALKLERTFFYYAAFKRHIGVYPPVTDDQQLIAELKPYANKKGNLAFPLNASVPCALIARVARALAKQYAK